MIDRTQVTACLVTRGDHDLSPIYDSLIFSHAILWDNSADHRQDLGTYGRYAAAAEAPTEYVYFQDDDVIVPPDTQTALSVVHRDGLLTTNTEPRRLDEKWVWLGFGSLVHRDLPEQVFQAWGGDRDEKWFRLVGCDILFGQNVPAQTICQPFRILDYAYEQGRVYRKPGYGRAKQRYYREAMRLRERWTPPVLR